MKKKYLYTALFCAFGLFSCEDILEPKIDGGYGDEFTWKNPNKAKGILLQAYDMIPKQWDSEYSGAFLDVATDNAVCGDLSSSMYKLGQGGFSNSSYPLDIWNKAYTQFYNINLFLENGLADDIIYRLSSEDVNQEFKKRLKGVAHFLRAWWGSELLRVYGGLSEDGEALGYYIVTETLRSPEQGLEYQRNTYEECVQQILKDCETALTCLPEKLGSGNDGIYSEVNIGAIDRRTVWALKSRVTLYAASPAYRPQGSYAISDEEAEERWERAARISCEALDATMEADGKPLIGSYVPLKEDKFNQNKTPDEFLFCKFHNNQSLERSNFPPRFRGNAHTQPSQNLVDAFYDINGYPIDHVETVYNDAQPYELRDPRLDWNIYYDGRVFGKENVPLDIYVDGVTGRPAQDAEGFDYRNSRTGYYLRKWLSTKAKMLSVENSQNDNHMHAIIRRAEIYHNCAEALNEAVGPKGVLPDHPTYTAYGIMWTVRKAAELNVKTADGYLDEVATDKDSFRKLIQNERRIEFAFENQRYFDMRRWLLPLDESVRGVKCVNTDGTKVYDTEMEVENRERLGNRNTNSKYYYAPLPYDELVKNPLMKDNRGWSK